MITRLSINKCQISHSATYKVVAKNEFGEDECSAILTVKEQKDEEEEEEVRYFKPYIIMTHNNILINNYKRRKKLKKLKR
ncbi:hypothetical protein NQ314_016319 [Rhamnusium bicolor]|uniref:Immunoglobulin I-set domain-containing protein n=1 Tax=Rhamnusium bicolor TaxID=1586634 RepID=A0AAV8WWN2_9CUCU|nr:hypothetical protein NQ314_016319 [Rhamnusium bicolor]